MCKKLNVKLDNDDIQILKMVYFIRNKLSHEEYFLIKLIERMSKNFSISEFLIQDFRKIIIKFAMLIENFFLKILRFYQYYLELIESSEYFHHIKFKRAIFKNIDLNDEIISNYNNYEFPLRHLLQNKYQLLRRGKFISIYLNSTE